MTQFENWFEAKSLFKNTQEKTFWKDSLFLVAGMAMWGCSKITFSQGYQVQDIIYPIDAFLVFSYLAFMGVLRMPKGSLWVSVGS